MMPGMMGGIGFMTKPAFATDFGEYPTGAQLKDFGWTEQGVGGARADGIGESPHVT